MRKTDNPNYLNNQSDEERMEIALRLSEGEGITARELWEATEWPINSCRRILCRLYTKRLVSKEQEVGEFSGVATREFRFTPKPLHLPKNPEVYWERHLTREAYR